MPDVFRVRGYRIARVTKMYGGATLPMRDLWESSVVETVYSFCPDTMLVVNKEVYERTGSFLQFEKPPAVQSSYFLPKLFAPVKQTLIHTRYTKLNDPCSQLSQPFVVSKWTGGYPASTHAAVIQKDPAGPTDNEFLSWSTPEQLKVAPRERGE